MGLWPDSLKDSRNYLAWSGAVGRSLFLAMGLGSFSGWSRCLLGAERRSDADNTGMISASRNVQLRCTSPSPEGLRRKHLSWRVVSRKEHEAFFSAEEQNIL